MREKVLLICEECLSRNYTTTIKKEGAKNLQIKKYCKRCNKMTLHKISKSGGLLHGCEKIYTRCC